MNVRCLSCYRPILTSFTKSLKNDHSKTMSKSNIAVVLQLIVIKNVITYCLKYRSFTHRSEYVADPTISL